jgi:hypothetical protein
MENYSVCNTCHALIKQKVISYNPPFDFEEKQGRLVFKVTAYLKKDLTNEELAKVYRELELKLSHILIDDFEIGE